jgi:hypothetical protein
MLRLLKVVTARGPLDLAALAHSLERRPQPLG